MSLHCITLGLNTLSQEFVHKQSIHSEIKHHRRSTSLHSICRVTELIKRYRTWWEQRNDKYMEICFACPPEHTEGEEQREHEWEKKKINERAGQGRVGVYKRLQKKRQGTKKVAKAAVIELSSNGSNCYCVCVLAVPADISTETETGRRGVVSPAACCHSHLSTSPFWWELIYSTSSGTRSHSHTHILGIANEEIQPWQGRERIFIHSFIHTHTHSLGYDHGGLGFMGMRGVWKCSLEHWIADKVIRLKTLSHPSYFSYAGLGI